ncbi:MAG TPA: hypothetical protein VK616_11105, partial [Flavitalea sp.]|nr:hypothetical protein [Flavitalea sp.]
MNGMTWKNWQLFLKQTIVSCFKVCFIFGISPKSFSKNLSLTNTTMIKSLIPALIIMLLIQPASIKAQKGSWQFNDKGISRKVLENYLERAVTMVYLLMPDKPEGNREYPS